MPFFNGDFCDLFISGIILHVNLQKLSDKAGICSTKEQILEKALKEVRNTQDFESALET